MIEFGLNGLSANPSSRHSSIRINDVFVIGKIKIKNNYTYTQNQKKKKKCLPKNLKYVKFAKKIHHILMHKHVYITFE